MLILAAVAVCFMHGFFATSSSLDRNDEGSFVAVAIRHNKFIINYHPKLCGVMFCVAL